MSGVWDGAVAPESRNNRAGQRLTEAQPNVRGGNVVVGGIVLLAPLNKALTRVGGISRT